MDESKKMEIMAKAKEAASVEDLIRLAKTYGVELTEDTAAEMFADLNKDGAISDAELDNVSGGGRKHWEDQHSVFC